jgi:hypothetical protein
MNSVSAGGAASYSAATFAFVGADRYSAMVGPVPPAARAPRPDRTVLPPSALIDRTSPAVIRTERSLELPPAIRGPGCAAQARRAQPRADLDERHVLSQRRLDGFEPQNDLHLSVNRRRGRVQQNGLSLSIDRRLRRFIRPRRCRKGDRGHDRQEDEADMASLPLERAFPFATSDLDPCSLATGCSDSVLMGNSKR